MGRTACGEQGCDGRAGLLHCGEHPHGPALPVESGRGAAYRRTGIPRAERTHGGGPRSRRTDSAAAGGPLGGRHFGGGCAGRGRPGSAGGRSVPSPRHPGGAADGPVVDCPCDDGFGAQRPVVRVQRLSAREAARTGAGDPAAGTAGPQRGAVADVHRSALPQCEAHGAAVAGARACDAADAGDGPDGAGRIHSHPHGGGMAAQPDARNAESSIFSRSVRLR